jgi:AAA15 family ATPase/GTPase
MLYEQRRIPMLIEFRVANHRSLRDEQVLTMEAGRVGDESDQRPRHVLGHSEDLLPVAVLYGANASGKSNVLAALAFMREAVLMSHRFWSSDEGLPRDPFSWGKRTEPSLFEVTLLLDGVRFQYGFRAADECFLEEWLHAWPHGKKQVWFERDRSEFKFGDNLKGENKLIVDVTRPNALFLSAAVQHNHPQLTSIFAWFRSLQPINLSVRRPLFQHRFSTEITLARLLNDDAVESQQMLLSEDLDDDSAEPLLERFRNLLKKADIGIVDLRAETDKSDDKRRRSLPHFFLKHQSESDDAWLPLEEESRGTRTLFYIAMPILQAIENGGILVVDELERSLHPTLAQQIIRQFNDALANPKNAQIIFTTHDTNLLGNTLGEPALRRDQVWLTEKDSDGATVLYPLTDYKPRKAENLERGYLQGRYGAIPFLGDFLVALE